MNNGDPCHIVSSDQKNPHRKQRLSTYAIAAEMVKQCIPTCGVAIHVLLHDVLAVGDADFCVHDAIVVCEGTPARFLAIAAVTDDGALVVSRDCDADRLAETCGCLGDWGIACF